ncbi:MAG: FUSC family protein [Spartobacteria bacterium]|nr:FUSC family protein [Spartobacteria bacterium]
MKPQPTTRQAIQMMTAVGVIYLLAWRFPIQRSYWAIITVMSVLCQTWGESIQKAGRRIAATLLGLVAGTLLYSLLHAWPEAITLLLALMVFLTSYYMTRAYTQAVFWMSIMLVLLFGLMNAFSFQVVIERAYETMIGAVVAVTVAATVFPTRSKGRMNDYRGRYLNLLMTTYDELMSHFLDPDRPPPPKRDAELIRGLDDLRTAYDAMRREMIFYRRSARRRQRWFILLENIQFNLVCLGAVREEINAAGIMRPVRDECRQIQQQIHANFVTIIKVMNTQRLPEKLALQKLDDLEETLRKRLAPFIRAGKENCHACVGMLPVFYYSLKINTALLAIADDINERWN